MPLTRCPNAVVTGEHLDIVNLAMLAERGVLPDPGAWLDQSATFAAAYPTIAREIETWRQRAVAAAQAKQNKRR